MTPPEAVIQWCRQQGYGDIVAQHEVGGGCINNGQRLITDRGPSLFLKQNSDAPFDMFAREAEGLAALAGAPGPRVPQVLQVGRAFLLLEDLAPAPAATEYWQTFGAALARQHQTEADTFGFDHDNYIGRTPQPNDRMVDGFRFFRRHRLRYQAGLALEAGLLNSADGERVEELGSRLESLVPAQPAALLHGDLWSGNAITDENGAPALIDPAAHYGWPEAELAMTALFGGFPETFYAAYQTVHPLAPGWRDRFPIYNLYHLLNHLNLFGRSYLPQVKSVLAQFT